MACFLKLANADINESNISCLLNTPIQEKTGSRMETRPKSPSVFASPGGKYKLDKQSLSKKFQDGASKY